MGTGRVQIHFVAGWLILHLLAVPCGAFERGDLAGDWWLHGLISGDSSNPGENPGWFWISLAFDADGNGSATSAVHDSLGNTSYVPTVEQYALDRFGGVTSERIDNLRGVMRAGKDLIVATATMAPGAYEDVRGYNLQIYTRAGSGFTTTDLAGTWRVHGVISGDGPQFTSWRRGTVIAGADGAFSATTYDVGGTGPESGSGRANLTNGGVFTIQEQPSSHGVMSGDKNLVVFTMDDGGGGYSLYIWQRHSTSVFSDDDLTGVWHMYALTTGDAPQWTGWARGDMEVRSSGACAVSLVRSDDSIDRATDTLHIDNDGVVTMTGAPSAHGVMSDDKTLVVLTITDGGGGYDLVILNRAATSFFSHDYGVGTPEEYGIKTFEWTYGKTGEWTSQITGPLTVDYNDGSSLTGVEITNVIEVNGNLWSEAVALDGSVIKALTIGNFLLSPDEHLTSHPDAWSFDAVTDGMLLDMRPYYLIRKDDPNQVIAQMNQMLLYHAGDVNVLHGQHADALVAWTIDTRYPYAELNLFGKDADLGLTLPTAIETAGYAVAGFRVRAPSTSVIALGRIDPQTGQLQYLGELKEINPYVLHDWNSDGFVSIVGDVPPFVNCVYFNNCPADTNTVAVGDCNDDGFLSIVGDVPCFVNCVYFQNCP